MPARNASTARISPRISDVALVERCRAGDGAAWHELLQRYADLIYSVPLRRGLGIDAAEEIFQSVSTTLCQRIHLIADPTCLPKWLLVTTRRRAAAYAARARNFCEWTNAMATVTADTPETLAVGRDLQRHVKAALLELRPRDRAVLIDLFEHELPYAEVARRHQVAVGSLGALRARALGRLRRVLERKGVL